MIKEKTSGVSSPGGKVRKFEYHRATSIEGTLSLMSRYGGKARILAGGTDLLPQIRRKKVDPEVLIDIKNVSELDFIKMDSGGSLKIGALTTLQSIVRSDVIRNFYPVLAESAQKLGSREIRNVATLGGNLCNASPSADMASPLIALGATARILGTRGERIFPLEDFFVGPSQSVLAEDEILLEVQVEKISSLTGCVYLKHTLRRAMDIALVGAAVALTLDSTRTVCQDVKIVLGAVAPIPLRAKGAEGILRGQRVTEDAILKAAEVASEEAKPIGDIRSSAEYRKEMVKILTGRAIEGAQQRGSN
jgi:carbon-monoxide dehydrogenase medium subunit